jgi:hypothetical protein
MLTVNPSNVTNLAKTDPACDKFKLLVSVPINDLTQGSAVSPDGLYNVAQFEFSSKSIRTPQNYGATWRGMIIQYICYASDVMIVQIRETGATFFVGPEADFFIGQTGSALVNYQIPLLVPGDFTLVITNYSLIGQLAPVKDHCVIYLTNEETIPFSSTALIGSTSL